MNFRLNVWCLLLLSYEKLWLMLLFLSVEARFITIYWKAFYYLWRGGSKCLETNLLCGNMRVQKRTELSASRNTFHLCPLCHLFWSLSSCTYTICNLNNRPFLLSIHVSSKSLETVRGSELQEEQIGTYQSFLTLSTKNPY